MPPPDRSVSNTNRTLHLLENIGQHRASCPRISQANLCLPAMSPVCLRSLPGLPLMASPQELHGFEATVPVFLLWPRVAFLRVRAVHQNSVHPPRANSHAAPSVRSSHSCHFTGRDLCLWNDDPTHVCVSTLAQSPSQSVCSALCELRV